MRIAVVFDNLGPYHIARLKALSNSANLLAIEVNKSSFEYAWKSAQHVPFSRLTLFESRDESASLAKEIGRALDAFGPDVVFVPGWRSKAALLTLLWALSRQIPAILMSASQEIDFRRSRLKEFVKRKILRGFSGAIVGGRAQASYVKQLGMAADTVRLGYNVVDNSFFKSRGAMVKKDAAALRRDYELPSRFFLTTARLIEKKNLSSLLEAYSAYRIEASPQQVRDLVVLGDGELRSALEEETNALGLSNCVYYPGFKQIDELPIYYGLADAFILPSLSEQWGLVVNEAMASGLPVLVSDRCGCAVELVEEGVNGYRFPPTDTSALTALMLRLSRLDNGSLADMGSASKVIIERWSPDVFRTNAMELAELVNNGTLPRAPLLTTAFIKALTR